MTLFTFLPHSKSRLLGEIAPDLLGNCKEDRRQWWWFSDARDAARAVQVSTIEEDRLLATQVAYSRALHGFAVTDPVYD